jgi:ParB-like nuclease domain
VEKAEMAEKITLSASRDIPFNKLVLSQSNVRRIKAGVSIEELAEDIARRTLLQSLTVRPVRNADDAETGLFEVPAGGRRYRALELLVKQKRLAKTAPIPCIVRDGGIAEEDSLAENIQRAPLQPLTNSARSWRCGRRDKPRRRSPRRSLCRRRSSSNACGSHRRRQGCSTSMPRTA